MANRRNSADFEVYWTSFKKILSWTSFENPTHKTNMELALHGWNGSATTNFFSFLQKNCQISTKIFNWDEGKNASDPRFICYIKIEMAREILLKIRNCLYWPKPYLTSLAHVLVCQNCAWMSHVYPILSYLSFCHHYVPGVWQTRHRQTRRKTDALLVNACQVFDLIDKNTCEKDVVD